MRLGDAFEEVTLENTPLVIFDYTIFWRHMVKDLQDDLELLKKVKGDSSGYETLYLYSYILCLSTN